MKIGLFIQPGGEFYSEIIRLKDLALNRFGKNQVYVDHPPHLTVFTLDVKTDALEEIINVLRSVCAPIVDLKLISSEFHIFNDDVLTGGDTITRKVVPTSLLRSLQLECLESLQAFRVVKPHQQPFGFGGILQKNFDEFGFAFCGSIWIPHVTLTSLLGVGNDKQEFIEDINSSPLLTDHPRYVSLWNLDENTPKRIVEIDIC